MHKSWKYEDKFCTGCGKREESGDKNFSCEKFQKIPKYEWFFGNKMSEMIYCAEVMRERLKVRQTWKNTLDDHVLGST